MIFSQTTCPICCKQLLYESIYSTNNPENSSKLYFCDTKISSRNMANTGKFYYNHYENRVTANGQVVFMIIPPYELCHSSEMEFTSISQVSDVDFKKFIFRAPLLDYDYTDTQTVVSRLKLLVTFS